MRHKKTKVVLAVLALAFMFSFVAPTNRYFYIARSLDTFFSVFKELNTYYVDVIEPKPLIEEGLEGMLASLDPYSSYIAEEHARAFNTQTTGQYAGIGILIGDVNGKSVVLDIYEGFAAHKAGIHIGDEIVAIDDTDIQGRAISEVSKLLKGAVNTSVKLLIRRRGRPQDTLFSVVRERIKLHDIAYHGMLPATDVGYIKLDDFREQAGAEVARAVASLKKQGARKLILDLRDNPGGLLYEAINVANVFLPKGLEVVSVQGREKPHKRYASLNEPVDERIPVAVLIGEGSASASEIVAGALQDYDRAVLVGHTTFGKGLVQTTRPLPYDAQLKITTAKYYIPSGRCIQAIDYTHEAKAAEPPKGRDYVTRGGRKVYESKGIAPDIEADASAVAPITARLVATGQVFDYAALFCSRHARPAAASQVVFTEADYNDFVNRLDTQSFRFSPLADKALQGVIKAAKEERVYDTLHDDLAALARSVEGRRTEGLHVFKEEIMQQIRYEIWFHYGFFDSPVAATLPSDAAVQTASALLQDSSRYARRLAAPLAADP